MSKKQRRVQMLIDVKESLDAIGADSENQTEESIKENMKILSDTIVLILGIDNIVAAK